MSEEFYKEVRFDKYCKTCKHIKLEDTDEPCNECLSEPVNYATERPVKWEGKDE